MSEAAGRMRIAARQYRAWPTEELWWEFGTCTDRAWELAVDGEPDPIEWAVREAIGLALIARGATAAELERGWPMGR